MQVPPRGHTASGDDLSFATLDDYDAADQLVEEQGPVVDDEGTSIRPTSTYTYYADGTLRQSREPGATRSIGGGDLRRVTDYDYDGRGNVARRTQRGMTVDGGFVDGQRTWMWEYDPAGNLRRIVNPDGVDTANGVVDGIPTRPKATDDYATTSDVDANIAQATIGATIRQYGTDDGGDAGLVSAIWQPRGDSNDARVVQRFNYDTASATGGDVPPTLGRLTTAYVAAKASDDPATVSRSTFGYFANGWIETAADDHDADQGRTRSVRYDYDEQGRQTLWRTRHDDQAVIGGKVTRDFWPNGLLRTRTGRKFQIDSTGSDVDDASTVRTYSYYYNPNGSLTELRDLKPGHDTLITRDAAERERAVNEAWASGKDSWFGYDADGNLVERKTDGHLTDAATGAMDDAGDIHRTYALFDYDNAGHELTSATWEPTDVDPEPAIGDCHAGGSAPSGVRCVRSTYHPSGERETRRMSNGTVVTTLSDEYGQASVRRREPSGGGGETTDYSYDARGNRTADERGTYTYNARDQLTRWDRSPSVPHPNTWVEYTMSPSGSLLKAIDHYNPVGSTSQPITTDYTYAGERLVTAKASEPVTGTSVTNDYCYNDFGSVIAIHRRAAGDTHAWCDAHAADSQPVGDTCNLPTPDPNSTSNCYDEFDRLKQTRADGDSRQVVSNYDGLDRRDAKTVTKADGSTVHRDLSYVGTSPLLSREVTDDGGVNTFDYDSAGERLTAQIKKPADLAPVSHVLATDANGSVVGLEDANGLIDTTDQYHYDPFGALDDSDALTRLDATDPTEDQLGADAQQNPFRFEAFYDDAAVKTYDMQARDYRPDVGRFLQQDIYESAQADLNLVADPLTQNRYAFAGGNPVNNIEYDGHYQPAGDPAGSPGVPYVGKNDDGGSGSSKAGFPTELPARTKQINHQVRHFYVHTTYDTRRYQAAKRAAEQHLRYACLERCSGPERALDERQLAGARLLGLGGDTLNLKASMSPNVEATDDLFYLTAAADGGALLVSGLRAAGRAAAGRLSTQALQEGAERIGTGVVVRQTAAGGRLGMGLRDASEGLRDLFADGGLAGKSVIDVRSALVERGFARQALTTNKRGYLFRGPAGEQVRIMRREYQWEIRVQNRYGNYLDRFGNVGSPRTTHGIYLRTR